MAGEQHALELEVLARRVSALRPSSVPVAVPVPVTTLIACHVSDIVLEAAVRETQMTRLGAVAGGTLSSVFPLPLASATTKQHASHGFTHSTGFVLASDTAAVLAVVFWLGLAFWVHRDARRRIGDPFLRFLATLLGLVPYVGPVVYLLFRPAETLEDARSRRVELQALEQQLARSQPTCPRCSMEVALDWVACPLCTAMLRQPCAGCHAPLEPLWQMCPYCATPVGLSEADLDAALTAEANTLALVNDTVPLVPQVEQRAADA
jgi:hypothetical protein